MAVRVVRPEVALVGYTVFRDPGWYPEWRTDALGDAAKLVEFAGRMCFDAATEVLTDRGWRRFSALQRTERLATLNQETWNIEYQRPTDYFEYECDEPLFLVQSPYVNLAVTGEHWLYVGGSGERGFRLRRAAEAAGRSLRFLRSGHWRGERPGATGTAVGEIAGPRVRLSGGGGGRVASPALGVRARSVPLAPFLAFLGRYLAAGVCYAPPGGPGRVVLPQSGGTLELVGACGFAARTRDGQVVIEDASLYDYLGGLGESHSKRIPRPLLDLDPESLHILRGALFQGRRRFATPSPQLAGDVQELLLKTGASGNLAQTRPGRYVVGPRLAAEPSAGKVWCVTVPNHIVYVRRDGVPVWAGNCYQSWSNPLGRSNRAYIDNILAQQHFSVIEHASATLAIRGVSRSLTHELVRHRHFSFSQLSQRFVKEDDAAVVLPADIEAEGLAGPALEAAAAAQRAYGELVSRLGEALRGSVSDGVARRKMARQAARSVLPNMTETQIVVTGNLRAWASFLKKRGAENAEPEIRRLALLIWPVLRQVAPEVFDRFRVERTAGGREVLVSDVDFE
jgi:thymidylate synthase (FAD)